MDSTGSIERPDSDDVGIPWERRDEIGFGAALVRTVKLFALSPVTGFERLDPEGRRRDPLLFGLVVAAAALLLNILGAAVFGGLAIVDPPAGLEDVFELTVGGRSLEWIPLTLALIGSSILGALIAMVVFPPLYVIGLFAWAATLALTLRIVGATNEIRSGFAGAFAVAGYSSLAFVVHLIPMVGELVATVWVIVLQTVGLAVVLRTDRTRALFAVLLPALIPLGLLVLALLASLLKQAA